MEHASFVNKCQMFDTGRVRRGNTKVKNSYPDSYQQSVIVEKKTTPEDFMPDSQTVRRRQQSRIKDFPRRRSQGYLVFFSSGTISGII